MIDPKVISGDIEFGVAPMLWNRFQEHSESFDLKSRFEMLVNVARLDPYRSCGWTLLRGIDYWLWALGTGLTYDPVKCEKMTEWALQDA